MKSHGIEAICRHHALYSLVSQLNVSVNLPDICEVTGRVGVVDVADVVVGISVVVVRVVKASWHLLEVLSMCLQQEKVSLLASPDDLNETQKRKHKDTYDKRGKG